MVYSADALWRSTCAGIGIVDRSGEGDETRVARDAQRLKVTAG